MCRTVCLVHLIDLCLNLFFFVPEDYFALLHLASLVLANLLVVGLGLWIAN